MRKDTILSASDKGCIKCRGNNKSATSDAVHNIYYGHYRTGAISRGFDWNLNKEDFNKLISQDCFYCGKQPEELQSLKRYNRTNKPILVNGVDRINSSLGYSKENCVPCCTMCNRMKLDYSLSDFYNHVSRIYNHIKSSQTISEESTLQANGNGKGSCPEKDNDIVESV